MSWRSCARTRTLNKPTKTRSCSATRSGFISWPIKKRSGRECHALSDSAQISEIRQHEIFEQSQALIMTFRGVNPCHRQNTKLSTATVMSSKITRRSPAACRKFIATVSARAAALIRQTTILHSANAHALPPGAFAKVGREGWIDFMEDVGLTSAVLYPTNGLSFGRVVSLDWAIELAHAYNDWMHDEYLSKSSRFQALGLIPLQEPAEAVKELRRIVKELGFCGAMLPSTGVMGAQNHLGDEKYWPIYEEANRLECCIGIHGGVHDHMGLDDMTPYAPVNALGHPFGQMVNFAGILFNGVFDKYPKVRFGFMEAGAGWFVNCIERFERAWNSHVQYDPRGRFLKLREKESITDYIKRHVDEDRILRRCRRRRADAALRRQRRRQQAVYFLVGLSS